jgi:outer membrane lipoprotein LolB
MVKQLGVACFSLLLTACAGVSTVSSNLYSKTNRDRLYTVQTWHFEGRLWIASPNKSLSANADWRHTRNAENLKLSGPLGQGAVTVELADGIVKIDRGGGHTQFSSQPEEFINQQLGLFVPMYSLRYWVTGLPDSRQAYQETPDGFVQAGWLVKYKDMQKVGDEALPHKIIVTKDGLKLKLVIDQWDF